MKLSDYTPFKGFYDLRAFEIPVKDFRKLWNVQRFLYDRETERQAGKDHPQIDEIRYLSAQYQQILFQFHIARPELI